MKRKGNVQIQQAGVRDKLEVRRDPYWKMLQSRGFLGYRKTKVGKGTWVARWREETGKAHYKSLGQLETMDYSTAAKTATEWFDQCEGGVVKAKTVKVVCEAYLKNAEAVKGEESASDTKKRLARSVYNHPIADKTMDKLTAIDVEAWRDGLTAKNLSPNTVNRYLRAFKAAMNYGYKRGLALQDRAWRVVSGLPKQASSRTDYLSLEQRRALLANSPDDLAALLKGMMVTGARTGEIRKAKVRDLDGLTRSLAITTIKGTGEPRVRTVPLVGDGWDLFEACAKDKRADDHIFTEADGVAWSQEHLSLLFRAARTAADLPATVSPYTLRHSFIADSLINGVDIGTVAKLTGTSVQMIDETYHKFLANNLQDKLSRIARL